MTITKPRTGTDNQPRQDQHVTRQQRSTKQKRSSGRVWAVIGLTVAGLALVVALFVPSDRGQADAPGDIRFNFGYSRAELTRTSTISLCRGIDDTTWPSDRFPECPQYDQQAPGAGTRPAVTGASVAGDLSLLAPDAASGTCPAQDTGAQFPAGQITVTATNSGAHDVSYVAVANPVTPEEVLPGTYCGVVLISRAPVPGAPTIENPIVLPISVEIADRLQWQIIFRVAMALVVGALLGGGIKWVADNLGTIGAARRRDRRITSAGFGDIRNLPWVVADAAGALQEAIEQSDLQGIGDATRILESYDNQVGLLSQWAYVTKELRDNVDEQRVLLEQSSQFAPAARQAADRIRDAASRREILEFKAENVGLAQAYAAQRLTRSIRDALAAPAEDGATQKKLTEAIEKVDDAFADPDAVTAASPAPGAAVGTLQAAQRPRPTEGNALIGRGVSQHPSAGNERGRRLPRIGGRVMDWASRHSAFVILGLAALVAGIFGLSTQFLNDPTFSDSFTDYFTLFLWAFVGVLAGGTFADIVTRLNSATSPPARRTG